MLTRFVTRRRPSLPLAIGLAAVTVVAVVVRTPFFADGVAASDTTVYLRVAHDITLGLFPSDLRPPGYSLLLAFFEGFGINPVDGAVGLQNLIGILLPGALVLLGRRFFSTPAGLIAGFLAAASPLMTITEQLALADYLFGVALFGATALLAESALRLRRGEMPWRLLLASGLTFGLATMFRANGQLGFVVIPVVVLLATRRWRPALRPIGVGIAGMLVPILPVVLLNLAFYGDLSVGTEGGISLYSRAVTTDRVPPPKDSPYGELARRIYNTAKPGPLAGVESGRPTTALFDALLEEGKTEAEASSIMGALAKQAILDHPGIYLEKTWEVLANYRSLYDPHTFGSDPERDQISTTRNYIEAIEPDRSSVPGDADATTALWHIAQALTRGAYIITLGGLLALALLFLGEARKRLAASVFIVVVLAGAVGGSLTGVFSPRYDAMLAPFVWFLLGATLVLMVEVLARLLARPSRSAGRSLVRAGRRAAAASAIRGVAAAKVVNRGAKAGVERAPGPPARSGTHSAGRARLTRARYGLVTAALLAPFSATHLAGPLTLGRLIALVFAALLSADLWQERPARFHLDRPALLLVVAYVGLSAWILLSSRTVGCNCDGKAGGFFEFAFIGLLSLVAIGCEPRLRRPAMVAMLGGLLMAAALALAGAGSINSGTIDLTQTGGRLSGTYGNANELGFAMALGIPIALAYRSGRTWAGRIAFAGSLVVLGAALILTYSRGAVIAAAVGVLALALWEARASRRRILVVLGGAAACALVGAALYSSFERERENVSFESVPTALRPLGQRDLSGWDSRPMGPIPAGPSRLANQPAAIAVRSDRAGEGASFRWGEARPGEPYTLRFRARSEARGLPFSFALGDPGQPGGRDLASAELGPRWRSFSLSWRPRLRAPHATLYLWQRGGPSTFSVADVRLLAGPGTEGERHLIAIPSRLRGSLYSQLILVANREERRYVHSRLDAAHLALDAFAENPFAGIGWATFPTYSAAHLDYGQLAAHDQYLSFAAELGILGVLLLGVMLAGMAMGAARAPGDPTSVAALGVLVTAVAGMVFVEALPVPQLSISIALAAAVLCAPRLRSPG